MTDNRRRPKRGVRLSDLPDEVVRDLGDLEPQAHDFASIMGTPAGLKATKRLLDDSGRATEKAIREAMEGGYGRKRSTPVSVSIHGVKRMRKAAKRALVDVGATITRTIQQTMKDGLAQALAKQTDDVMTGKAPDKKPSRRQQATANFDLQLRQRGYKLGTDYVRELKFAKADTWAERGWRFDFALPKYMLAIEIEGLVVRMVRDINTHAPMRVVTGRHATITGIREDCHKYAAAEIMGWHVIRVEQDMIANGDAIAFVERFVARRKHERSSGTKRKRKR